MTRAAFVIIAFMLLSFVPAPALAQDAEEPFVGIGLGEHRLHFDSDDRDLVDVGREDEIGGHLRVGLIRPDYRVYGQWTLIRPSGYLVSSLTVNADALWYATPRLSFFGGVGGGAITLSWDGDNSFDTMPAVSLQGGVIYAVTRRVDVELGVRQMFTRLRTEPQGNGSEVDVDLDRLSIATAGINLRF